MTPWIVRLKSATGWWDRNPCPFKVWIGNMFFDVSVFYWKSGLEDKSRMLWSGWICMVQGCWRLTSGRTIEVSKYVCIISRRSLHFHSWSPGFLVKWPSQSLAIKVDVIRRGWVNFFRALFRQNPNWEIYRPWCHVSVWFSKCNQEKKQTCVNPLVVSTHMIVKLDHLCRYRGRGENKKRLKPAPIINCEGW